MRKNILISLIIIGLVIVSTMPFYHIFYDIPVLIRKDRLTLTDTFMRGMVSEHFGRGRDKWLEATQVLRVGWGNQPQEVIFERSDSGFQKSDDGKILWGD